MYDKKAYGPGSETRNFKYEKALLSFFREEVLQLTSKYGLETHQQVLLSNFATYAKM